MKRMQRLHAYNNAILRIIKNNKKKNFRQDDIVLSHLARGANATTFKCETENERLSNRP